MQKSKHLFCIAACALVWGGCSTTTHSIAKEEFSASQEGSGFEKLLVVGSYNDRAYRISAETLFAEVLKENGINAEPSFQVLPSISALDTEAEATEALGKTDCDGVVIIATLDEGYDYDLGDYYATRGIVTLLGGRPGAGTAMGSFIAWAGSGLYSLYVGLWDTESLKPVWQMTTNSNSTGSDVEDNKALAQMIAVNLKEKGLVK